MRMAILHRAAFEPRLGLRGFLCSTATRGGAMRPSVLFAIIGFLIQSSEVWAAPPASCVNRFVGSWTIRVNATGQTYPAQFFANGRSHATCPMCTPGGSWTCSGNSLSYTVDNGVSGQSTLSADGKIMSGGCCTATRVGAAPSMNVAEPKPSSPKPPQTPVTANAARASQPNAKRLRGEALGCNPGTQEIAGCIDIPPSSNPGMSGARQPRPSPVASTTTQAQIAQAKSYMQAALTVKQSDPSYSGWSTAASQFRKAAEAFKAAGDLVNAAAANDQAQTLETALKLSRQDTGQANRSEIGATASPIAACSGGDAGYPDSFWQAGNLNQRYGSSWSCKMISLVPQSSCELYNSCLPCMNGNEDFYQDSRNAGHCVARAGGGGQPNNSDHGVPGRPTMAAATPKPVPESTSQRPLPDPSSGASLPPPPLLPPGSICEGSLCAVAAEYPPPPPPPNGACNWNEAKVNLDWVLQDAGAKATYFMWRGYGLDPVRAAIQAQAHNRHAQQTMMNCFSNLPDALASEDPSSRNPRPEPLPTRQLALKDCHCITILPTGANDTSGRPEYSVKNGCIDTFMMSVTMLGSVGSSKPSLVSNSEHEFLMPSQKQINYSAPDSAIVSIYGWTLRNAASKLQCFIPQ